MRTRSEVIYCNSCSAPETFAALARVLGPHGIMLHDISVNSSGCDSPTAQGLLVWFDGSIDDFLGNFAELWKKGCRRFVVLSPLTNHGRLWAALPNDQCHLFRQSWVVCSNLLPTEIANALRKNSMPSDWLLQRLDELLSARELYRLIRRFGHGSERDLTNQFLGPARLLLMRGRDCSSEMGKWKELWSGGDGFERTVLTEMNSATRTLHDELKITCSPIQEWLRSTNGGSRLEASALESLMLLLTRVRVLAGEKSQNRSVVGFFSDQVMPVQNWTNENREECYRILVVDDHSAAWRPVFEELGKDLNNSGLPISFEFSLYGKTVIPNGATTSGPVAFGFYDLIILDVFLGRADGRELLKMIRRDFPYLPVLLWTTSRRRGNFCRGLDGKWTSPQENSFVGNTSKYDQKMD